MHRIASYLAILASGITTVVAAADVTPGLPVRPISPPQTVSAPMAPPSQVPAAVELTPDERRVAQGLTAPEPRVASLDASRAAVKAPPAVLTVKPNVTTLFGVALNQSNRMIVPFKNPSVQTAVVESAAEITIDPAGIVYVTPKTGEPIGLFVYDPADPKTAISVTAVPAAIPPVSVSLQLAGYYPPSSSAPATPVHPGDAQSAKGFETDQPFTETLKEVFKALASGKVPSGYSLGPVDARNASVARCNMPGFRVEASQLITGFNINVVVSKVTNTSMSTADVVETGCAGREVLAAAAWPTVRLAPGQSAELYVAVRAPSQEASDEVRPSLISEAH